MNELDYTRDSAAQPVRTNYAPQTFFRVLSVLNAFTINQPELTLRQISQRCQISSSTLYRYLRAMEDEGYISHDPERGKYMVGFKLIELGGMALSRLDFQRYGQIALDKLSSQLQLNSHMGLLYEGDLMHVCFAVHEDVGPRHSVIGRRSPAHCTAMGKVLLASLGRAQAHKIIDTYGWRPITSRSISDFRRLDEELDEICRRGYALDYREAGETSGCVAFPVVAKNNQVVAAISVSTTAANLDNVKQRIIEALIQSAEKLSYSLGFQGTYPFIRPQGYFAPNTF